MNQRRSPQRSGRKRPWRCGPEVAARTDRDAHREFPRLVDDRSWSCVHARMRRSPRTMKRRPRSSATSTRVPGDGVVHCDLRMSGRNDGGPDPEFRLISNSAARGSTHRPDGKRHRAALSPEPRRDDRPETTGRAAGRHQEQVLGVGHGSILGIASVPNHPGLADLGPFAATDAGHDRTAAGTRPRA